MKRLFPVLAVVFSCSKPPPVTSDAAPPSNAAPSLSASSEPAPSASVIAPVPSAQPNPACPAGMVLVDGDYCTELELKCKEGKEWYAPWNDKHICTEFEEPSRCTGKKVHKRFCIDEYEYPNKKGERPKVNYKFHEAQRLCAEQGKRVCTETEWTTACEGPDYKPYPYGYVRDPTICNGDRQYVEPAVSGHDKKGRSFLAFDSKDPAIAQPELERLWQGVESGSQPKCVSDYGAWDMPGNADELASSETPEPTSKFDNVTTGGPWLNGVRNQCRPKIYTHDEGFNYYYLSTRCCAETDGKPTDPRAPKQIKRGEKWRP